MDSHEFALRGVVNRNPGGGRRTALVGDEDSVLHEQTQASSAMDGPTRDGRRRLHERHFPPGPIDKASELLHVIMEEFNAFFRGSVLAAHDREEPVLLEAVRVFRGALDRHPEPLPNRAESGVAAGRDLVKKQEARTRPEIS